MASPKLKNNFNTKPINRFFFFANCETPSNNYPGLVDAIYIVFFNDRNHEYRTNELLMALKDLHEQPMFSDLHDNTEKKENVGDEEDKQLRVLEECAHLSWKSSTIGGMQLDALRVPINVNKSSFSSKSQGEAKGKTYLNELNAVLEERGSQVSELFHALHHTGYKLGVFFRDANGDTRLMVDPDYPMSIETSDETGEGPTGTAAATIKFSQTSKMPPMYYRDMFTYAWGYGSGISQAGKVYGQGNYTTYDMPPDKAYDL